MTIFGVSYRVVGRADCPYFARAERLAQLVKLSLELNEREIQIEPIDPSLWTSHCAALCQRYGFPAKMFEPPPPPISPLLPLPPNPAVLIYHPHTGRLVGDEKAFRKEVAAKYGIECDLSWGRLQAIARENGANYAGLQQAIELNKKKQPFIVSIIGPVASGKTTLARGLEKKLNAVRISSGEILRDLIEYEDAGSVAVIGIEVSQEDLAIIRAALLSGELVPDSILLPLVRAKLHSQAVQIAAQGLILDGFPRTEYQANALKDLASSLGEVSIVIRLSGLEAAAPDGTDPVALLDERVVGRRIDWVTKEIYHTTLHVPTNELTLSRLVRRWEQDGKNVKNGSVEKGNNTTRIQLRAYEQQIDHITPLFKGRLENVSSVGTQAEVLERVLQIVGPIVNQIAANRHAAAQQQSTTSTGSSTVIHAHHENLHYHPLPPAQVAQSSSTTTTASPSTHASPVVSPTVESVIAGVVAQPLSRRSSLNRASSITTPAPTVAPTTTTGPSSKPHSRRTSASGIPPVVAATSTGGSKPNSRRGSLKGDAPVGATITTGSKPNSRRGSLKAGETTPTPAMTAGGPIHSRKTSLTHPPVVARRSSRASGSTPLIPAGVLASQPAPAAETVASASASAPVATEEEVVLHKRASKRASGIPVTAATTTPLVPQEPIAAAAPVAAVEPKHQSVTVEDGDLTSP